MMPYKWINKRFEGIQELFRKGIDGIYEVMCALYSRVWDLEKENKELKEEIKKIKQPKTVRIEQWE